MGCWLLVLNFTLCFTWFGGLWLCGFCLFCFAILLGLMLCLWYCFVVLIYCLIAGWLVWLLVSYLWLLFPLIGFVGFAASCVYLLFAFVDVCVFLIVVFNWWFLLIIVAWPVCLVHLLLGLTAWVLLFAWVLWLLMRFCCFKGWWVSL